MLNGLSLFVKADLLKGLEIFWKGMLAIFIVLLAIALITYLLNFIFRKLEEKKKLKDDAKNAANAANDQTNKE